MTKPDLSIKPDEIHWRVGSTYEREGAKFGMLLGYIDARDAMTKLDLLDANWSSRMESITVAGQDGVRCTLTVNGVSREDVGVPSDTEGLKGAFSDALKRAAVQFGIGRELYDLPTIAVECEVRANGKVGRPKALPSWNGNRWTIDSNLGWVRYDQEPTEQSQAPASGEARPAAKPASGGVPTAAPADSEEGLPEFPPFDPTDGDAVVDAVVEATGGTEVTDLSDRIARAEAKGAAQKGHVCPEHGAEKVKKNRRGYYCATKVGDGWCSWQEAA